MSSLESIIQVIVHSIARLFVGFWGNWEKKNQHVLTTMWNDIKGDSSYEQKMVVGSCIRDVASIMDKAKLDELR